MSGTPRPNTPNPGTPNPGTPGHAQPPVPSTPDPGTPGHGEPPDSDTPGRTGLPLGVLSAVIGLPLLLVVAAVVIALVNRDSGTTSPQETGPLAPPAVPAPAAGSGECAALLATLPQQLRSGREQLGRRPLAEPAPPGTAAWGVTTTAILRCGLDRPAELTPTAELLEVSGVRWLRLTGDDGTEDASTWVAVDRPVYVALTLPDAAGTGPLQDVSTAIAGTLPSRQVEPAR